MVSPGGYGTLKELMEIITWSQLGIHDKQRRSQEFCSAGKIESRSNFSVIDLMILQKC